LKFNENVLNKVFEKDGCTFIPYGQIK
jgi:hypothetical protein